MLKSINTSNGLYKYKPRIVYEGIKKIDKAKACDNLLLFKSIADRNNVPFGLIFGTFLGAMREHDFIEYDEDIDLFVLNEHKELFLSLLFELRDNGFEVIRYDRRGDLCSIMRNGEYIDILFFKEITNGVMLSQSYFVPRRYLTEVQEYKFQNDVFMGPKDGKEFLLFWYGENWKTPIQRDNYDMAFYKRKLAKIKWIVYDMLPNSLFSLIINYRRRKKIIQYNQRVDRLNNLIGRNVLYRINAI